MGILKEPVLCQPGTVVHANNFRSSALLTSIPFGKARYFQSSFRWSSNRLKIITKRNGLVLQQHEKKIWPICCSFSSFSDGNGSIAENFNLYDEEYINSTVIEAVEARSESDGLIITMHDGRDIRCMHIDAQIGNLLYYPRSPAIVLKMEDGSDILLPLLVVEMSSALLIAAICNIQLVRPTMYEVVKEMIEKMGYAVHLVRVTKRVEEAYFAKLYLKKIGSEKETICLDLRPSDAINIAVRCKVPIQVNRHLVQRDGMRIVEPTRFALKTGPSDDFLLTELDSFWGAMVPQIHSCNGDEIPLFFNILYAEETKHFRPDDQPCYITDEFGLVRNMLIAVVEERYRDAARWRNKLFLLRSKKKNWH